VARLLLPTEQIRDVIARGTPTYSPGRVRAVHSGSPGSDYVVFLVGRMSDVDAGCHSYALLMMLQGLMIVLRCLARFSAWAYTNTVGRNKWADRVKDRHRFNDIW